MEQKKSKPITERRARDIIKKYGKDAVELEVEVAKLLSDGKELWQATDIFVEYFRKFEGNDEKRMALVLLFMAGRQFEHNLRDIKIDWRDCLRAGEAIQKEEMGNQKINPARNRAVHIKLLHAEELFYPAPF